MKLFWSCIRRSGRKIMNFTSAADCVFISDTAWLVSFVSDKSNSQLLSGWTTTLGVQLKMLVPVLKHFQICWRWNDICLCWLLINWMHGNCWFHWYFRGIISLRSLKSVVGIEIKKQGERTLPKNTFKLKRVDKIWLMARTLADKKFDLWKNELIILPKFLFTISGVTNVATPYLIIRINTDVAY